MTYRFGSIPLFLRLKFLHLLLIGLTLSGQALAGTFAEGLVVYLTPGDTPETAKATLFRKFTYAAPLSYYDIGASAPLAIENGMVLKRVDISFIYGSDLATLEQRLKFEELNYSLKNIMQQHPKAAPICESVLALTNNYLKRYAQGEVRLNANWEPRSAYESRERAARQQQMEFQAQKQAYAETQQILAGNLKASYTSAVAQLMQKDYARYSDAVKINLNRVNGTTKNLGVPDPEVVERSFRITPPSGVDEAGIYSSEHEDGPTVIWTTRSGNVVSYWLGFCIVTDADNQELLNNNGFGEALAFANKVRPGLIDGILAHVAASRIEQVLGRMPSVKSETTQGVEMDILVNSPAIYDGGTKCHYVYVFMFPENASSR